MRDNVKGGLESVKGSFEGAKELIPRGGEATSQQLLKRCFPARLSHAGDNLISLANMDDRPCSYIRQLPHATADTVVMLSHQQPRPWFVFSIGCLHQLPHVRRTYRCSCHIINPVCRCTLRLGGSGAAAFTGTTHDLAAAGTRLFGLSVGRAKLQVKIYEFALYLDAKQASSGFLFKIDFQKRFWYARGRALSLPGCSVFPPAAAPQRMPSFVCPQRLMHAAILSRPGEDLTACEATQFPSHQPAAGAARPCGAAAPAGRLFALAAQRQ